jgi:hypothetical protein
VRIQARVDLEHLVELVEGAEVEEFLDHEQDYYEGVIDETGALVGGLDVVAC